ncbi:MAG: hypothetical protein J1E16_11645 [Muribaculaceae bacterium]|nr:hypothetical protein [Muribaculaceae bacterium]
MQVFRNIFLPFAVILFSVTLLSSCSDKDDEPRMPEDLAGIWSPDENTYLEFTQNYSLHKLDIEYQDGESIGLWTEDAYIYEPGYHIVILLKGVVVDVYQVVELNDETLTWCWVDDIVLDENVSKDTIGKLLGDIIKQAQEGFKLDPELYQTFRRVSEDDFYSILEKLDLMYPW